LDAARARKLLRAEEQRIQQELEGLRTQTGGDSELSSVDQHPADAGTELFEEERAQSMIDRLEQDLQAVERAMKRVDDGTYGVSIESGQPIPDSRLEAVPHAERTVEEQARFEAEHRNSV
jgi:RNA polymerase-binding transcription factor DksA